MTTSSTIDKRHVSAEGFDQLLGGGVPVTLPVGGEPETFVFIEPRARELGLRIEVSANDDAPDTGLRNIFARTALRDGKYYFEVVVRAPELFHDAYPVLCSIADRVQLGGMSPVQALHATLDRMSSLLRTPDSLPREREIGLFGELLVLGGLIERLGASTAVESWCGSQNEEHDFGLPDFDVEVKTTTSESRTHWIESLTQLVPKVGRSLWLVSHQLTTAGVGAGLSLPDLVEAVSTQIDPGYDQDRFANALSQAGWRDDYRKRLTTRWTRRVTSRGYRVSDTFPRLTLEDLLDRGVAMDRITEIHYRVDLDGFADTHETPEIIRLSCAFEG
ncbi:PD-(D/E)XK motif protein [Amycolatopsis speibonae]|uniref:PD-(D/E)XK motif protein n=1 Tax=Amycolatopsis speibonae TaxID=1450224 RepID=A0ABV7NV57_9PSEU